MHLKIAIQPDRFVQPHGDIQSFSDRWRELADESNVSILEVDVFSQESLDEILSCDAFMWRFPPTAFPRTYARRLLFAIEKGLGIPTYPAHRTAWHFEDKIAQSYFFQFSGLPTPKTNIFWTLKKSEEFCEQTPYPFVLKLASGFKARNVRLIRNKDEALYYVYRLFGPGLTSLDKEPETASRMYYERARAAAKIFLEGKYPTTPTGTEELHQGYFYTQEFLPGNEFDTRVAVIENRAFAFRRFNRPNDFRASGSGRNDWDPTFIDERAIRLAFKASKTTGAQTMAVDIVYRNSEPVIVELGLAYTSWGIRGCPGHWVLNGDALTGTLEWHEGSRSPEGIIFENFIAEIRQDR